METIKQLSHVSKVGLYDSVESVKDAGDFLQYNLIYGFNGCGKTTLSRLFNSLAEGEYHPDLPDEGVFSFITSEGDKIERANNSDKLKDKLLVFNVDFVQKNFRWADNEMESIIYLGQEMTDSGKKLKQARAAVVAHDLMIDETNKQFYKADKELSALYRDIGKDIKKKANLNAYNAGNVKGDILKLKIIDHQKIDVEDYQASLATVRLDNAKLIVNKLDFPLDVKEVCGSVEELCMEQPALHVVENLIGHESLLNWISEGLEYHKDNDLKDCKFCSLEIPSDRINNLEKSLDDKFETLMKSISEKTENLKLYILSLNSLRASAPINTALYSEFGEELDATKPKLYSSIEILSSLLNTLIKSLEKKSENLVKAFSVLEIILKLQDEYDSLLNIITSLNLIIDESNNKTNNFAKEKTSAINLIKTFLLIQDRDKIKSKKNVVIALEAKQEKNIKIETSLALNVTSLINAISDHGKAAELINDLLQNYLGHSELSISLVKNGYKIERYCKPLSGPISEGEKTAVSLCYFISKLREQGQSVKDRIIVVDDPISSLDTKAQNYACNLIQRNIINAGQIFILTHNLHFMNECKKWLRVKAESKDRKGNEKAPTAKFFFLEAMHDEKKSKRVTRLYSMPKLLAEYDTEYHFLFSQVYGTSCETSNEELHTYYILPNVIRKVLETFFAFKFPRAQNFASCFDQKAIKECGVDDTKLLSLKRLAELESHGQSVDKLTSLSHLNIEEVREAAVIAMELIEKLDSIHFKEMKKKCEKIKAIAA